MEAGIDHSVLYEFRARLLSHDAADRSLAPLLDTAREGALLRARGRQRTERPSVSTDAAIAARAAWLARAAADTFAALQASDLDLDPERPEVAAARDYDAQCPEWGRRYRFAL